MTEKLEALENISRLSERVVRILGQNPGKFTLQGTNTYLISGPKSSYSILVDTAEGADGYEQLLEQALHGKAGSDHAKIISDIILTHRHHDHVDGLPSVLKLLTRLRQVNGNGDSAAPPRIHKFPDAPTDPELIQKLEALPEGSYTAFTAQSPLWPLADGDILRIPGEEKSKSQTSLKIIHTPGHTADHVGLLLLEERVLFAGDHVLGQGTSVFEDLGAYLRSLRKCSRAFEELDPCEGSEHENTIYPGHGPVVLKGRETLQKYLQHRLERESQVVELLSKTPPAEEDASTENHEKAWTIRQLVQTLYASYPPSLYVAAARGLLLHLRKLALPDPEATTTSSPQVRCLDVPSDAGETSNEEDAYVPRMPQSEEEWLKAMELRWVLLAEQPSQSQSRSEAHDTQKL